MPTHVQDLADWQSFYVIVGSSAGALTGLMFVVIALTSRVRAPGASHAVRAYASPTIVHFSTVLSLAAVLSMPRHTRGTMGAALLIIATGSLGYVFWAFLNARAQDAYVPDRSDWIWHTIIPAVAYSSIFVAGGFAWSSPRASLYVVGGSMLVLLYVGIRNAWDSAVWQLTRPPDE